MKLRSPDWKRWIRDSKDCESWLRSYMKRRVIAKSRDDSARHIRKVDHNLRLASWLIQKHSDELPQRFGEETFYDWVVCIYYYAIYHAALALVSKEGYHSASHSATLCFLIHHNYHLKKELDQKDIHLIADSLTEEDINNLGSSKELREKASYDVHYSFEQSISDRIRLQAGDFIAKAKIILRNRKGFS